MKKILGVPEGEESIALGKKITELPNIVELGFTGTLKNVLERGEKVEQMIIKFKSIYGKEADVLVDIEPIFTLSGEIDGMIILVRDITQQRKLELEMLKLSQALRQLFDAVMITDINGNIEYVNPAFEKMTGYTLMEVIGKNPRILKSGKHDKKFFEDMWRTIKQGKVWRGELINRRKNGELYYEEMTISPLVDSDGNITHFIAIKRDITESKLIESQIMQVQKLESIGSIAGGIAHDFNNILTSILTSLDMLEKKLPVMDSDIFRFINVIRTNANHGADITRRLLNFVRRETGRFTNIDVEQLINEVVVLISHSFPKNIKIETDVPEGLKYTYGDYSQIIQALMNLCINSKDAMPEGGILKISARIVPSIELKGRFAEVEDMDYIMLSISDTGSGIPDEIKDKIFEPFFTTKSPERGTGLGLPIVWKVIRNHRGYITFESEVGRGTTFFIYLPAVEVEIEAMQEEIEKVSEKSTGTILIVEDEEHLRLLLKDYLESKGFKILEAVDGYEALEIYKKHMKQIDLSIIDIGLPQLDGITTFRKIMQMNPDARVVLSTGYFLSEPSLTQLMAEEGLAGFIQKPYNIKDIESLIAKLL
jgi:PAS domain S-box-containing protein